jgi:choline kinase
VGGTALVERVIRLAVAAGVEDILVVTGFESERVEARIDHLRAVLPARIASIHNRYWERENGWSVYAARERITGPFFLLMSDHIFDASILSDLGSRSMENLGLVLAVDRNIRNNPFVDLGDVTKVETWGDRIVAIGKTITHYNAFDTGIFRCKPDLFQALEESMDLGDDSLSGGVRILAANDRASAMDIGGRFWVDVDDERALAKAEEYLKTHG